MLVFSYTHVPGPKLAGLCRHTIKVAKSSIVKVLTTATPKGLNPTGQHPEPRTHAYSKVCIPAVMAICAVTSIPSYTCGHKHKHGVNITRAAYSLG